MSFSSLLNKRCSWVRRIKISKDKYRQSVYTESVMGSNVRCRIEKIHGFNLWQGEPGGDFNRSVGMLFMKSGNDILPNDFVTIDGSENYKVMDDDDFSLMGHHIEVRVEKTKEL